MLQWQVSSGSIKRAECFSFSLPQQVPGVGGGEMGVFGCRPGPERGTRIGSGSSAPHIIAKLRQSSPALSPPPRSPTRLAVLCNSDASTSAFCVQTARLSACRVSGAGRHGDKFPWTGARRCHCDSHTGVTRSQPASGRPPPAGGPPPKIANSSVGSDPFVITAACPHFIDVCVCVCVCVRRRFANATHRGTGS